MDDYADYDGVGLAELVSKREVTPAELIEAAIARTQRLNPQINAVVYEAFDEARASASRAHSASGTCRRRAAS